MRKNDKMQSKAHQKATEKYNKKAYENIRLRVKSGKKEIIEKYCKLTNNSINNYINMAIDEQLKKDGYQPDQEKDSQEPPEQGKTEQDI